MVWEGMVNGYWEDQLVREGTALAVPHRPDKYGALGAEVSRQISRKSSNETSPILARLLTGKRTAVRCWGQTDCRSRRRGSHSPWQAKRKR